MNFSPMFVSFSGNKLKKDLNSGTGFSFNLKYVPLEKAFNQKWLANYYFSFTNISAEQEYNKAEITSFNFGSDWGGDIIANTLSLDLKLGLTYFNWQNSQSQTETQGSYNFLGVHYGFEMVYWIDKSFQISIPYIIQIPDMNTSYQYSQLGFALAWSI